MGERPLVAGLDVGTSRIRALVFEADGTVAAEAAASTPTSRVAPGAAEHDPALLWRTVVSVLRDAVAMVDRPQRIRGVACASFGEAGVLLDAHGTPIGPILAWYDGRPGAVLEQLVEDVGRERLMAVTGLCPDPTFTLAKLAWAKAEMPEALRTAVGWLPVGAWIAASLCGERAIDLSLASRTMALDLAARCWDRSILEAAGLPARLMGAIAPAGTRLAPLLPEVAAATGLPTGCVVGVGGHDHLCGLLAVGADAPGVLMNSLGTAEALTLVLDRPVTDGSLARSGFHQGVVEVDRPLAYVFGGLPTSAAAVEWFRAGLADGADHATLVAEAAAVPDGVHEVMFLPQLRLGSPPHGDPVARGAFLGLSDGCDRGVLFRAVLEGLALDSAHQVQVLEGLGLAAPDRVMAIGGGTRNALLMQLKASLLGRPIETVEMPEATALGAALLGGLAAGVWPDLATARAGLSDLRRLTSPDERWSAGRRAARIAAYAHAYGAHRAVHARLRQAR